MKMKCFLKGGLTSLCVFTTSCGAAMKNNPTEFDWYATECAPKHYPMKIIQGTFYYKDQDKGLYIPSGGQLSAGWGRGISSHVAGSKLKPLPDSVALDLELQKDLAEEEKEYMRTTQQIGRVLNSGSNHAKLLEDRENILALGWYNPEDIVVVMTSPAVPPTPRSPGWPAQYALKATRKGIHSAYATFL